MYILWSLKQTFNTHFNAFMFFCVLQMCLVCASIVRALQCAAEPCTAVVSDKPFLSLHVQQGWLELYKTRGMSELTWF